MRCTLPPQTGYNIDSPEQLSVKLPREALRSGQPLTVNNTAIVAALAGQVRVVGSFTHWAEERALQSPHTYELIFILENDKWEARIGQDSAIASAALLHGSQLPLRHEHRALTCSHGQYYRSLLSTSAGECGRCQLGLTVRKPHEWRLDRRSGGMGGRRGQ